MRVCVWGSGGDVEYEELFLLQLGFLPGSQVNTFQFKILRCWPLDDHQMSVLTTTFVPSLCVWSYCQTGLNLSFGQEAPSDMTLQEKFNLIVESILKYIHMLRDFRGLGQRNVY